MHRVEFIKRIFTDIISFIEQQFVLWYRCCANKVSGSLDGKSIYSLKTSKFSWGFFAFCHRRWFVSGRFSACYIGQAKYPCLRTLDAIMLVNNGGSLLTSHLPIDARRANNFVRRYAVLPQFEKLKFRPGLKCLRGQGRIWMLEINTF